MRHRAVFVTVELLPFIAEVLLSVFFCFYIYFLNIGLIDHK